MIIIADVVGPLGKASHIENFGTAVSIGGGVGTAIAYPTAVALKQAGNHTISIIGGRTKEFVILENEMKKVCDEVFVTTDDGSYGKHGFVTDQLKELIEKQKDRFCTCDRTNSDDESSCRFNKGKGYYNCCKSKSNYGRWNRNVWRMQSNCR